MAGVKAHLGARAGVVAFIKRTPAPAIGTSCCAKTMLPALTLFTTCKPVYELRSGRGPHRMPRSRLARFECVRLLSDRAHPRALTMLPACCSRVSGTC